MLEKLSIKSEAGRPNLSPALVTALSILASRCRPASLLRSHAEQNCLLAVIQCHRRLARFFTTPESKLLRLLGGASPAIASSACNKPSFASGRLAVHAGRERDAMGRSPSSAYTAGAHASARANPSAARAAQLRSYSFIFSTTDGVHNLDTLCALAEH